MPHPYERLDYPINYIGNVDVLKLISQKFKKYICLPAADGIQVFNLIQKLCLSLEYIACGCRHDPRVPCRSAGAAGRTQVSRREMQV